TSRVEIRRSARKGRMWDVETVGSEQVYVNDWLTIREDTLRDSDGTTSTYAFVEGGDIVLAVPFDGDGFHLVEQYRHPVGGRRWEFPSGNLDVETDSDSQAAARRELREEAGLLAGQLIKLGTLEITPSTMSQRCHVFLATDLAKGQAQPDKQERDLRSQWYSVRDVEQMISNGSLNDAKSLAAYALLLTSKR